MIKHPLMLHCVLGKGKLHHHKVRLWSGMSPASYCYIGIQMVGFFDRCKLHTHLFYHVAAHYANMSVQYTAIFHGCKNDNFQKKIFDIFLIFAQNIDCGYTLEPPQ